MLSTREKPQSRTKAAIPSKHLTMRLSDAGLHLRQTKVLYPNHRLPPWPTEDATRGRSNRLLEVGVLFSFGGVIVGVGPGSASIPRHDNSHCEAGSGNDRTGEPRQES